MAKLSKRRGYHHGNLRQALIEAAAELVAENGPHGFAMREAARRAGVSSGAPYKHFADQKALMVAVASEGLRVRNAMMDEAMAACSDPRERFRAMGIAYVTFAVRHPGYFRVMNVAEYADPAASDELAEATRDSRALVDDVLAASRQRGEIYAADQATIFLAAQCLVHGLACMFVDGHMAMAGYGPEQAETVARAVTEVFGHGLIPRADGA
jgi:AcrR family transcriptional regulator